MLPGGTCDPAGDPIDRPVVIWHIPHPDDEILGMAGGIYESVLAGNHNIVVLYTVGESSLVRVKLVARALMQPLLQPADSGHIVTVPLRAADFGRARLSESIAALSLLGVNEDCIIVVELPDRALTQQRALTVMRELALLYPAAACTTSVYDAHVDHGLWPEPSMPWRRNTEKTASSWTSVSIGFIYTRRLPPGERRRRT